MDYDEWRDQHKDLYGTSPTSHLVTQLETDPRVRLDSHGSWLNQD